MRSTVQDYFVRFAEREEVYYLYDAATHELSVYDPTTHKVRAATQDEVEKAMALFREQR